MQQVMIDPRHQTSPPEHLVTKPEIYDNTSRKKHPGEMGNQEDKASRLW